MIPISFVPVIAVVAAALLLLLLRSGTR